MLKKLNKYYFLFILFFFSLLLITNNKLLILDFLILGCVLFFIFKFSFKNTLSITLFSSLAFDNTIRQWLFQNIRINADIITQTSPYYFGITIKLLLCMFLSLLFIFTPKKNKPKYHQLNKTDFLIIIFFVFSTISCFLHLPNSHTLVGFIRIWQLIALYFITKISLQQEKIKTIIPIIIYSLLIFSVSIGIIQLLNQHPLGRYIELTPSFTQDIFYTTTDGATQYRASGFVSHPVYFGTLLCMLLPISIAYYLNSLSQKNKLKKYLTLSIIIVSLVTTLGTLSRSTWINLFIIFLLFYPKLIKNKIKPSKLFLIGSLLLITMSPLLLTRIDSIKTLFSTPGSNGSYRLKTIYQSLLATKNHPLFGIGINQFPSYVLNNFYEPFGSPAPVHNTFFLFLSELGIPAGITFILFCIHIIKSKYHQVKKNPIAFSILIGVITFIISAQFHPLFIMDPSLDLFIFFTAYLSTC